MRAVPPLPRSRGQAVLWWERRRLGYNALVIVLATVGAIGAEGLARAVRGHFAPTREFALFAAMGLLVANVLYTFAWVAEVRFSNESTGRRPGSLNAQIPLARRANQGVRFAMEAVLATSALTTLTLSTWYILSGA